MPGFFFLDLVLFFRVQGLFFTYFASVVCLGRLDRSAPRKLVPELNGCLKICNNEVEKLMKNAIVHYRGGPAQIKRLYTLYCKASPDFNKQVRNSDLK